MKFCCFMYSNYQYSPNLFSTMNGPICTFLSQDAAIELDLTLMETEGSFTLDQLMELAGLSVAQCIYDAYPPHEFEPNTKVNIAVCSGSGNNGGDGLVAARHLIHFGYNVTVFYPKASKNPYLSRLCQQLKSYNVPILQTLPKDYNEFNIVVDAILGFGFKSDLREPFKSWISSLINSAHPKIISIDVPSGWPINIKNLNATEDGLLIPSCLVSLTLPKNCAIAFNGIHYLGGRFVPPKIVEKFNLTIPTFPGSKQFVRLT